MTPREFSRERVAAIERDRMDLERDVARGWFTAAFVGAAFHGKLPSLSTVMDRIRNSGKRQTFDQMKAQLMNLSQLTGFPMREIPRG